ncbi:uncharacterized protein LOC114523043 [Dendronephthya gigantea]|uniref:uncharacterized protein LOC114523043 n=1 Tax=Dendronephthya gigantea TaxID=151771 RepID=UPI00106CED95|nr:uncharacterized protein LOC114523043 [Dendronephthya gigantea]
MCMPWVRCLLFVILMCFTASSSGVEPSTSCSANTVFDIIYDYKDDVQAVWSPSVPNANYSVTVCCNYTNPEKSEDINEKCPKCPNYSTLKDSECINRPKKKTECPFLKNLKMDTIDIIYGKLIIQIPGCSKKHMETSIEPIADYMKLRPVEKLTLHRKHGGFVATWDHLDDMELCYFYNTTELLDNGKKRELPGGKTELKTFSSLNKYGRFNSNTHYEFCVRLRYCKFVKSPLSEMNCKKIKLPPSAPSKSIKLLCGVKGFPDCLIVKNEMKQNVTLIWKLPEKSSWNGQPTVIIIKIIGEGENENDTYSKTINATRTNYTLTNLKREVMYTIELTFCSNGGNGPSTSLTLHKDVVNENGSLKNGNGVDPVMLIIICVASGLLLIIVSGIIGLICWRSRKHRLDSIPDLHVPREGERNHTGTDPGLKTNPSEYNYITEEDQLDLSDKTSYEKLSCDGSSSGKSSNDSVTCPLVPPSRDTGRDDVTYYAERSGDKNGYIRSSSEEGTNV